MLQVRRLSWGQGRVEGWGWFWRVIRDGGSCWRIHDLFYCREFGKLRGEVEIMSDRGFFFQCPLCLECLSFRDFDSLTRNFHLQFPLRWKCIAWTPRHFEWILNVYFWISIPSLLRYNRVASKSKFSPALSVPSPPYSIYRRYKTYLINVPAVIKCHSCKHFSSKALFLCSSHTSSVQR